LVSDTGGTATDLVLDSSKDDNL
jgi:hypothetical protein